MILQMKEEDQRVYLQYLRKQLSNARPRNKITVRLTSAYLGVVSHVQVKPVLSKANATKGDLLVVGVSI